MTNETKHTPEPWVVDELGDTQFDATNHAYGIGADKAPTYRIAKVEGKGGHSLANADRIVLAVNACAGIPTDALEAGAVKGLLEACQLAVRCGLCDEDDQVSLAILTAIAAATGKESHA